MYVFHIEIIYRPVTYNFTAIDVIFPSGAEIIVSPEVRGPGREDNHSLSSSAEVKSGWKYIIAILRRINKTTSHKRLFSHAHYMLHTNLTFTYLN